jgi:hypothetical protein
MTEGLPSPGKSSSIRRRNNRFGHLHCVYGNNQILCGNVVSTQWLAGERPARLPSVSSL